MDKMTESKKQDPRPPMLQIEMRGLPSKFIENKSLTDKIKSNERINFPMNVKTKGEIPNIGKFAQ